MIQFPLFCTDIMNLSTLDFISLLFLFLWAMF